MFLVFFLVYILCLPVGAKELPVNIQGKPNPQVLAAQAWQALKQAGFVKGTMPPRYQLNAFYEGEHQFRLEELIPTGRDCLMGMHFFHRRGGQWYLSVGDVFDAAPRNINMRNRDYLSKMLDFYDAPTAYPPIVEPKAARAAYQLLLTTANTEQWRLQPDPSLKFTNPPVTARDEPRTMEAFESIMASLRSEARYVGVTRVTATDQVCWVQAEDRFSLFLQRMIDGDQVVTDWYANIRMADQPKAWRRVCTVPVHEAATGGRLTLGQLIEQQPKAQALLRIFLLAAMQNIDEVMSYCAGSVSQADKKGWWPHFYQAAKSTTDILQIPIEPLPGGQYLVHYPTPTGNRAFQCKVLDARLQVTAVNSPTIAKTKPVQLANSDRAILLVRRALKQVDQQGGIDYFYYYSTDPLAQRRNFSQFRAWANDRWEGDRVVYLEQQLPRLIVTEHRSEEYRTVWITFQPGLNHIYDIMIDQALAGRYGVIRPFHKEDIDAFFRGYITERKNEVKAIKVMQL